MDVLKITIEWKASAQQCICRIGVCRLILKENANAAYTSVGSNALRQLEALHDSGLEPMTDLKAKVSKAKINNMFRLGYKLAFHSKSKRKKWSDIFPLWHYAATNGHTRAQFYLGTCYDNAFGTKRDLQLAFDWYLKAAKAGHRDSQYNVGFFFGSDELRIKNQKKKIYWYKRAAKAGLIDAQLNLGYSYIYGEGVKVDKKRAVQWYRRAASQKDNRAFYNLGLCYKHGAGVQKSRRWSKYYFVKADEFGHKLAKAQLKELGK